MREILTSPLFWGGVTVGMIVMQAMQPVFRAVDKAGKKHGVYWTGF